MRSLSILKGISIASFLLPNILNAATLGLTTDPAFLTIDDKRYVFTKPDEPVSFESSTDSGTTLSWTFDEGSPGTASGDGPHLITYDDSAFEKVNEVKFTTSRTVDNVSCETNDKRTCAVIIPQVGFVVGGSMSSPKIADPIHPITTVRRIGALENDTLPFRAFFPGGVMPANGDMTWEGEQTGTGRSLAVTFTSGAGNKHIKLKVGGSETNDVIVTIANPTGPGEVAWAFSHPIRALTVTTLANEAGVWAGTAVNDVADARRHAYWSALMVADWGSTADAEGAATAHEVTNIGASAPHNEVVMDLENNAVGRGLSSSGATRATLQAAIAVVSGARGFTILDPVSNTNEESLLVRN